MPFDNMGGRFRPEPGIGLTDPRFYPVSTIAEGVAQPVTSLRGTPMIFRSYTGVSNFTVRQYTAVSNLRIA